MTRCLTFLGAAVVCGWASSADVLVDFARESGGMEVRVTGGDRRMKTFALKPLRRAGNVDVYDAVLPVAERAFGFDVHVLEDDGEGQDGWLQLRNESEGSLCVSFEWIMWQSWG